MANPWNIVVTVKDNDNDIATFGFYLGSFYSTLAALTTVSQALTEKMQACITGQVTKVQFSRAFDTSGWALTPSPGASTDRLVGGRIQHQSSATPNARTALNLPTFDLAKVLSPGKDIDTADSDVVALLNDIISATYTNATDIEMDTFVGAKETYGGKSR